MNRILAVLFISLSPFVSRAVPSCFAPKLSLELQARVPIIKVIAREYFVKVPGRGGFFASQVGRITFVTDEGIKRKIPPRNGRIAFESPEQMRFTDDKSLIAEMGFPPSTLAVAISLNESGRQVFLITETQAINGWMNAKFDRESKLWTGDDLSVLFSCAECKKKFFPAAFDSKVCRTCGGPADPREAQTPSYFPGLDSSQDDSDEDDGLDDAFLIGPDGP